MRVAQAPRLLRFACGRGACATKTYLSHRVSAHFVMRSKGRAARLPAATVQAGPGRRRESADAVRNVTADIARHPECGFDAAVVARDVGRFFETERTIEAPGRLADC